MVKKKSWKTMNPEERRVVVEKFSDMSAGEISKRIPGSTRNAIIGFCHRQRILFGGAKGLVEMRPRDKESEKIRAKKAAATLKANKVRHAAAEAASGVKPTEYRSKRAKKMPVVDPERIIEVKDSSPEDNKPVSPKTHVVDIFGITETTCRWPLNESYLGVNPDRMFFCGKYSEIGRPYCMECSKKSFGGLGKRIKSAEDEKHVPKNKSALLCRL